MKLKYVGNGNALAGIPARDLTEEETEMCCKAAGITIDFLVQSGLYQKENTSVKPSRYESKVETKEN